MLKKPLEHRVKTLLEPDFNIYIDFSVQKSHQVPKGYNNTLGTRRIKPTTRTLYGQGSSINIKLDDKD